MANDLTPRLKELYDIFELDSDLSVTTIFERFTAGAMDCDHRHAQQYLGAYFTKLNRRLRSRRQRVQPGRLKGTYRLVSTR